MTEKILVVSNRLPVAATTTSNGITVAAGGGGLATGLGAWHQRSNATWIGWPGDISTATAAQRRTFERRLRADRIVPVHLTRRLLDGYYAGFANRVLWPWLHGFSDRLPVDGDGWPAYVAANEVFAAAVARHCQPGDAVWIHDYQLMLVPAMLRARMPDVRIGFFLHVPFPAPATVRVLPQRKELLLGLLRADLVGFHVREYADHFLASLREVAGVGLECDGARREGRHVQVGAFPMGIDADAFGQRAGDHTVQLRAHDIRRDAGGRRLVVGVDRLDYTKGLPQRLEAIERLLQRNPSLRDELRYIQVAVPSRGDVDAYRQFRADIEARVGRVNGTYGTLRSLPVHYIHQSLCADDLVALYRAADVMLVTPLRDGMNLVAKEFVACRPDEDGVLVLSEFAGAAAELDAALLVNPYDADGMADAVARALAMPRDQRRSRMERLRERVTTHDVDAWARAFLDALTTVPGAKAPAARRHQPDGRRSVLSAA